MNINDTVSWTSSSGIKRQGIILRKLSKYWRIKSSDGKYFLLPIERTIFS